MLLLTPGHRTACKEYTLNGDQVIRMALQVNELFIDYDQYGNQIKIPPGEEISAVNQVPLIDRTLRMINIVTLFHSL